MELTRRPATASAADRIGLSLLLVGSERVGDERRLRLVGEDLREFVPRADQGLSIWVMRGTPLHRSCRIDGFDSTELRLDLTLQVAGDADFEAWAVGAEIGDRIAVAPQQATKPRNCTEDCS